jgi:hypothetical protein
MKRYIAITLGAAIMLGSIGILRAAPAPDIADGGVVRRLTNDQYANIIRDVFGPSIELGGRFEPELRVNGLLAAGSSHVSMTAAGMEQYDAMARTIAAQVVSPKYRAMIPCTPADAKQPDDACSGKFLESVGLLLYRRPLADSEVKTYTGAANVAAKATGDFYEGLSISLAAMLSSPKFLFRQTDAVADKSGTLAMGDYARASQLSFFLWNAGPDLPLLTAAGKGELRSAKGLARQVDRMMASPRLKDGVRAFFVDNFGFDEFASLTKDAALFPKFSAQAAADAQEQTLRTIVDLLLVQNGDYRDLFTTRKTFLTAELASIYGVPLLTNEPNGAPDTWEPYEFTAADPRAGILTHLAFTALHSPPGRGSPTLRGKALREVIMCQKVPAPPGDVNFTLVQDTSNPAHRTARDRLNAHASESMCTGCHKIIDPIGLALENFDAAGVYRTSENGAPIDTKGTIDGVSFDGAAGLGKALHDHPAVSSCLVNRMSAYAVGRTPSKGSPWVAALEKNFKAGGYRVPALMREIALSDALYRPEAP